jgi:hypothetical protein
VSLSLPNPYNFYFYITTKTIFFFVNLGMTTANMKLVILDVPLDGEMESPEQNLDDGESIVRRAVEVKDLYRVLKGMCVLVGGARCRSHHHTHVFDLTHQRFFPTDTKNIMRRRSEKNKIKIKHPSSAHERNRIISSTRGCCTSLLASTWQSA